MFIREFESIKKEDLGLVGGKGLSLGLVTQVGLNVPKGFVVTTITFENFLKETDLVQEIESELSKVDKQKLHTVDWASENIQALILSKEIPKTIQLEILKEFKSLNSEFVAVRSSATTEDGQEYAWAGQLDSYLNVKENDLIDKIKKCFASLFTPRALYYRFENNLHNTKISLAVVVQKMINSEKSGIAFSVHPITEDKKQILIEAGFGLGEAIVSGEITPNNYVVDKDSLEILDKNITIQEKALFKKSNGGSEWKKIITSQQTLLDMEIVELSKIVIQLENYYGIPQDVEWAYENNIFYITQSRPITTLNKSVAKEKYTEINENNYDFLWRVDTYFIFSYFIFASGYQEEDFIFVYEKGQYFTFVSKEARKRLGIKALEQYYYNFEDFKKRCLVVIDETNKRYSHYTNLDIKILDDNQLKKEWVDFIDDTNKILSQYFTLDYHSMDEIARISIDQDKNFDLEKINQNLLELGHIKLKMREAWNPLVYAPDLLNKFCFEIAERFKINKEDILLYNQFEILDLLSGKKVEFVDKSKGYVWGQKINNPVVGQEAYKILNQLWVVHTGATTIKGQIGNKGFYRGIVKKIDYDMVLSKEIEAMEVGTVLVAVATGPELVLACKKAGAIITDEGGIISHASIIARELNIPAVIGTKQATLLLRDGDEVEVDANRGIIKIIK